MLWACGALQNGVDLCELEVLCGLADWFGFQTGVWLFGLADLCGLVLVYRLVWACRLVWSCVGLQTDDNLQIGVGLCGPANSCGHV